MLRSKSRTIILSLCAILLSLVLVAVGVFGVLWLTRPVFPSYTEDKTVLQWGGGWNRVEDEARLFHTERELADWLDEIISALSLRSTSLYVLPGPDGERQTKVHTAEDIAALYRDALRWDMAVLGTVTSYPGLAERYRAEIQELEFEGDRLIVRVRSQETEQGAQMNIISLLLLRKEEVRGINE